MKSSKKVVRKYHKKLAKAIKKLKAITWYGRIWSSYYEPCDGITVVAVNHDHYTIAADINFGSKELYETILEGSNAPKFQIEINNCRVEHDSFRFECTVVYLINDFDGNQIKFQSAFKGSFDELHYEHPTLAKIINVKAI